MKRFSAVAFLFALFLPLAAAGREAKLVRYPHYHMGKIAFTYLGDIWTADENGQNIRRLTVHKARDVYLGLDRRHRGRPSYAGESRSCVLQTVSHRLSPLPAHLRHRRVAAL